MTGHKGISEANKAKLSAAKTWLFDLDNTLYPPDIDFFKAVSKRMTIYTANHLGLDGVSAREIQRYYYQHYGTTLRGLMLNDSVDPHHFLDFTHDIDYSTVPERPDLVRAVGRLPGRRLIVTNGPQKHAISTMKALGFTDEFEDIHDIVDSHFEPKPALRPYELAIARFGLVAEQAVFVEDLPQNLLVPKQLGMTTILVLDRHGRISTGQGPDSLTDEVNSAIDCITSDLPGFLGEVVR